MRRQVAHRVTCATRSTHRPAVADPYLAAIVRAVEDGAPCPALWMTLTSGDFVTGVPRPSRVFVEGSYSALLRRYEHAMRERVRKREERAALSKVAADEAIAPFNVNVDGSASSSITLADVTMRWSGSGNGARMPVIRLSLESIATWWIAGGEEVKRSNLNFFVGAFVPVGDLS